MIEILISDLKKTIFPNYQIHTPSIAIPRIPQDVIFVTGGWHQSQPVSKVQSYDSRADRWVFAPDDDPDGPMSYHGAASVGYKIYIIGGFDGDNYFNTCRVYDTLNKSWHEVSGSVCINGDI